MNDWMNNPAMKNIDPIKLELIKTAASKTSGKSGKELAPIMMALISGANKQGIRFTPEEMKKPMVGIVSSFNEIVPGHMNIDKITKQYNKALEIKKGDKYAETLKLELSKQEWQDELNAIEERISNILTKKDFEKCTKQLEQLFDSLYEKMTAPGLDAFVSWVEEHTKNNENNIAKLRDFLKGNYETYSSRIDSILSTLENISFDDDKCIFNKIISEFNKKLKSDVSAFVNKPDEFENNIDGFLTDLEDEFVGLADISELAYTKVEDLYTEEQKNDETISFYSEIIKQSIKNGQNLTALNESENKSKLYLRVRNRIASIKKVITILSDTGISSNSDDTLKQLFKKFDDTMLATKGDVAECLNNFIKNTWNDIEAKYIDIKEFYAEDELSFNKTWDGFEKEGEIDLLIKNYKTVRNANVLPQILTVKFEEIVPKLNKCHNEIAKLHSSEIKIFDEVKDCFDEFLANYNKTKKAMLEKIAKTHPELQNDIDSIYDSENGTLATIVNGLGPLSDFMNSISDETLDTMLEDKNKTQQIFEDIMKKSGLETEINWLQQKESLELTPSDLDHDYLRKLLESGLIKLSYTKEY